VRPARVVPEEFAHHDNVSSFQSDLQVYSNIIRFFVRQQPNNWLGSVQRFDSPVWRSRPGIRQTGCRDRGMKTCSREFRLRAGLLQCCPRGKRCRSWVL
jgi:hypothetical protein